MVCSNVDLFGRNRSAFTSCFCRPHVPRFAHSSPELHPTRPPAKQTSAAPARQMWPQERRTCSHPSCPGSVTQPACPSSLCVSVLGLPSPPSFLCCCIMWLHFCTHGNSGSTTSFLGAPAATAVFFSIPPFRLIRLSPSRRGRLTKPATA